MQRKRAKAHLVKFQFSLLLHSTNIFHRKPMPLVNVAEELAMEGVEEPQFRLTVELNIKVRVNSICTL